MAEEKNKDESFIKECSEELTDCIDRESDERKLQLQDLNFVTLDQWDAGVRREREGDINGARPCLTIDKIGQYRSQIINDIRKNRPSVKVRAVDDESDPDTAQIMQGYIRHVEDTSASNICYETAAEWAIDTGIGYWRYTTEYIDGKADEQDIFIRPIFNSFSVYCGPHLWPDARDMPYCYIVEDMPCDQFGREYPNAKYKEAKDFDALSQESPFWLGEKRARIVEKLYFEHEDVTLVKLDNGQTLTKTDYAAMPDPQPVEGSMILPYKPAIISERTHQTKKVKWCKLTAHEVLERGDWAGSYIPVVKVVGHQKLVDGKKMTWGIVRPAIDSQRMYNMVASTIVERIGQSPKTPYIAAEGQLENHEEEWKGINKSTLLVVQYKAIDVHGNAVPPPQRVAPAPVEAAMHQQLITIEHDIQTSLGMFKASVGETSPNQSGRAIQSLQAQSDTATFHFPDNLANSICWGGHILLDLIPKVIDTPRFIRLMGEDGKHSSAQLDPKQKQSMLKVTDLAGRIKKIYNLGLGTYDLTVTVGPSYATKRMETSAMLQEAMKGNPTLSVTLGDLMFKSLDSPMADVVAERLHKMLPPPLQDQQGDGEPLPPKAQMEIGKLKQALQLAGQKGQELEQENVKLKSGEASAMAKVKVLEQQASAEIEIKRKSEADAAQLAREVADEKARLAREVADAVAALAGKKLAHETDIRTGEHNLKVDEANRQREIDSQDLEATQMPKVADTLATMTQVFVGIDAILKETLATQQQILANATKARTMAISGIKKNAQGQVIGGTVTPTCQ